MLKCPWCHVFKCHSIVVWLRHMRVKHPEKMREVEADLMSDELQDTPTSPVVH